LWTILPNKKVVMIFKFMDELKPSDNGNRFSNYLFSQKTISSKTLSLFTHQLATLLQAGMPLLPSLLMLEQQHARGHFKKVISQLIASLHEGKSFSSSLIEYPSMTTRAWSRLGNMEESWAQPYSN
jgi:type II secretory pathway component PulF